MVDQTRKSSVPSLSAVIRRVSILERKMAAVDLYIKDARDSAASAAQQSTEILDFLKTTRQLRKHLRTAIGFGVGLLSAAGIGNPAVLHFLGSVFGH
jgi:hypothetical protein